MLISLCVIALNEENALKGLFEKIEKQTYPKSDTQVVLVNNCSRDGTKRLMLDFAARNKDYNSVKVVDCKVGNQAGAWNVAIINSCGDVIIRLDAHSSIPSDFLSENARCIESGEYVCGGGRPARAMEETPWQLTLLAAEESLFGSSFAVYRRESDKKRYVDSVFHGAYRREVFAKVGGFNEQLGRTEDNEMHYRIRSAGYRICCDPRIRSYQYIRSSLPRMMKQKFGNGLWVALTLGVCPGCISLFHFAPLALVCALILSVIFCAFGFFVPLIALAALYLIFDVIITAGAFTNGKGRPQFLLLPLIFPLLHISYGIGSLIGLIKMPFWRGGARRKSGEGIELVKNKLRSETGDCE